MFRALFHRLAPLQDLAAEGVGVDDTDQARFQLQHAEVETLEQRASTYVLIVLTKKELQLDASLYTLPQILSVPIFEKTDISCALQPGVVAQNELATLTN